MFYKPLLLLLALSLTVYAIETAPYNINAFTFQEKEVSFQKHASAYNIKVDRLSTDDGSRPPHCFAKSRRLNFGIFKSLMRLDTHVGTMTPAQSLFKSLTELDSQEEIIEFESIDNTFFVVSSKAIIYFFKENKQGNLIKESQVHLPVSTETQIKSRDFFMLINDYAPILIFPHTAIICDEGKCSEIPGWQAIEKLTHAAFLKEGSRRYILLTLEDLGFSIYQLTAKNELIGYKLFGPDRFNRTTVSIHDINVQSIDKDEIYVLDYESGLYSFSYKNDNPLTVDQGKLILDQPNCFAMDAKGYEYFVLNCRTGNSNYLMEVFHARGIQTYAHSTPVYKYESIYDLQLSDKYYIARGAYGFKFYWSRTKTEYPSEFKFAGELFLHNAVQVRFRRGNFSNTHLYYATDNEIRRVEVQELAPQAFCYSETPVVEQYRYTYYQPCSQNQNAVCQSQEIVNLEVWKHAEISVTKTVIPTLFTFLGLVVLIVLGYVLVKKYRKEEEEVTLKMANSDNDFGLDSNR